MNFAFCFDCKFWTIPSNLKISNSTGHAYWVSALRLDVTYMWLPIIIIRFNYGIEKKRLVAAADTPFDGRLDVLQIGHFQI